MAAICSAVNRQITVMARLRRHSIMFRQSGPGQHINDTNKASIPKAVVAISYSEGVVAIHSYVPLKERLSLGIRS
jgi:hypothetical protein